MSFKLLITSKEMDRAQTKVAMSSTIAEFETMDQAELAVEKLKGASGTNGQPFYYPVRLYSLNKAKNHE